MDPVSAALESGSEVEALAAIRQQLAEALLDADGKDKAPVAKELRAVLAELRRLGAGRTESAVDEIAQRRARRRAGGAAGAAGS